MMVVSVEDLRKALEEYFFKGSSIRPKVYSVIDDVNADRFQVLVVDSDGENKEFMDDVEKTLKKEFSDAELERCIQTFFKLDDSFPNPHREDTGFLLTISGNAAQKFVEESQAS